jgi:hypothetical protein
MIPVEPDPVSTGEGIARNAGGVAYARAYFRAIVGSDFTGLRAVERTSPSSTPAKMFY